MATFAHNVERISAGVYGSCCCAPPCNNYGATKTLMAQGGLSPEGDVVPFRYRICVTNLGPADTDFVTLEEVPFGPHFDYFDPPSSVTSSLGFLRPVYVTGTPPNLSLGIYSGAVWEVGETLCFEINVYLRYDTPLNYVFSNEAHVTGGGLHPPCNPAVGAVNSTFVQFGVPSCCTSVYFKRDIPPYFYPAPNQAVRPGFGLASDAAAWPIIGPGTVPQDTSAGFLPTVEYAERCAAKQVPYWAVSDLAGNVLQSGSIGGGIDLSIVGAYIFTTHSTPKAVGENLNVGSGWTCGREFLITS